MKKLIIILLCFIFVLGGCSVKKSEPNKPKENTNQSTEGNSSQNNTSDTTSAPLQLNLPKDGEEIAVVKTNMGTFKIQFFPQYAPKAVENFITHSKNGYYNGLIFHRVINDFMIQGGDPTGTGMGGESIWKAPFEDEFSPELHNFKGALSMANSGPNTNGSQFFIVQKKEVNDELITQLKNNGYTLSDELINQYKKYGGTPWLDNVHTVFGQVFEGMDIVDKIASVEVNKDDKPVKDVKIEKIEIVQYKK